MSGQKFFGRPAAAGPRAAVLETKGFPVLRPAGPPSGVARFRAKSRENRAEPGPSEQILEGFDRARVQKKNSRPCPLPGRHPETCPRHLDRRPATIENNPLPPSRSARHAPGDCMNRLLAAGLLLALSA